MQMFPTNSEQVRRANDYVKVAACEACRALESSIAITRIARVVWRAVGFPSPSNGHRRFHTLECSELFPPLHDPY